MIRHASLFVFLAIFLLGASSYATSSGNATPQFPQEVGVTRVYEVFGMNCPGCHGGVEKLVRKIPAIQQVTANWKEKYLTVTVKPGAKLNDEEIYDAIQRANFSVGKRIK